MTLIAAETQTRTLLEPCVERAGDVVAFEIDKAFAGGFGEVDLELIEGSKLQTRREAGIVDLRDRDAPGIGFRFQPPGKLSDSIQRIRPS